MRAFSTIRQWVLPCYAIGVNSYREAIRSKVLGSLVVLSLGIMGLGVLMGEMSLHNEVRVAANMGIFLTTILGVVMGIYASVTLLQTEFERRTVYTLLSKPIHHWQFLVGKLAGVSAICATVVLVLGGVSAILVLVQGGSLTATFFFAFFTAFLQSIIVASLSIFFSTFTGSLLAGICAFGIFVAGNLMTQIEAAINHFKEASPWVVPVLEGASAILPNLEALNLGYELTYSVEIPPDYVLTAIWYTASYIGLTSVMAIFAFGRRDFQ